MKYRSILKDGSLNIIPQKGLHLGDLYHDLLKISWSSFSILFALFYFFVNALFGLVYFLLPRSEFEGFRNDAGGMRYLESFFFSVQTFGTIGYGKMVPIGVLANFIVTVECFFGLFMIALATGLIFARFSRPSAKIVFSDSGVTRKFDGVPCLMFRMANSRQNYITDAKVRVTLALQDLKTGYRNFTDLNLERESTPLFSLSWTIAHDIDEGSPLYRLSREELNQRSAEIIVSFSGIDTTLSQHLYAKHSYVFDEIFENHDFEDVIERNEKGMVGLRLENFHRVKPYIE